MRTLDAGVAAHLASGATTLATSAPAEEYFVAKAVASQTAAKIKAVGQCAPISAPI